MHLCPHCQTPVDVPESNGSMTWDASCAHCGRMVVAVDLAETEEDGGTDANETLDSRHVGERALQLLDEVAEATSERSSRHPAASVAGQLQSVWGAATANHNPTVTIRRKSTADPESQAHSARSLTVNGQADHTVDVDLGSWGQPSSSDWDSEAGNAETTPAEDNSFASRLSIQTRGLVQTGHATPADYELLSKLGEGGMGVVYSARQASIDRAVAVKMLKNAVTEEKHRTGFVSEAVVTGELDHPNIVPIYDLGRDAKGALFYSMKQVQGIPWLEVIGEKSEAENLDILLRVADAVAFAHSRGVVHCDLKPENVMLGEFGEVLVMDWGLAQLMPQFRKPQNIARSAGGGGTPAYMAPEMAHGRPGQVGYYSDVYLLGAILFEIVVGKPPHTGETVLQCLLAAAKNDIRPTERTGELVDIAYRAMATDPADRFETVQDFQAAIREYLSHSESRRLTGRAADELEQAQASGDYQLFGQALAAYREASALWADNSEAAAGLTAAAFAYADCAYSKGDYDLGLSLLDAALPDHEELRRRIIAAQQERASRRQRLQRTRRILAWLGVATVCGAVLATALVNNARVEADRQRQLADDQRQMAEKQRLLATQQRQVADEQRSIALEQAEFARRQKQLAEEKRAEADEQRALAEQQRAFAEQQRVVADEQRGLAEKEKAAADFARQKTEEALGEAVTQRRLAEAAQRQADEARKLEEAAKFEALAAQQAALEAREAEAYEAYVARIQLAASKIDENSFDSARALLADCEPLDGETDLRGWEWARLMHLCHQSRREFDLGAPVDDASFAPDGSRFVTAAWDGTARIWDAQTGREIQKLQHGGQYVHAARFSPDGQFVVTGSNDPAGLIRIWDASSGRPVQSFIGHSDAVLDVRFSRDGSRVLSSSYDNTARLWDVQTGRELRRFQGHFWWVWTAAFSPDENRIVTASQDGAVIIWDVNTGKKIGQFAEHRGPVFAAAFSPDGDTVASAGQDGRVLLWEPSRLNDSSLRQLARGERVQRTPFRSLDAHTAGVRSLMFSAGGRHLLTAADDNSVRLWNVASGHVVETFRGHAGWVRCCALSPDGRWILSGSQDHRVKQWDTGGNEELRVLGGRVLAGHTDDVLAAAFSGDGSRIITASRDRTARLWSAANGEPIRQFSEGHVFLAMQAAFAPNGRHLFTAAFDNSVRIWNITNGTEVGRLDHTGRDAALATSHDGRWLLTGGDDNTASLWEVDRILRNQKPKPLRKFGDHRSSVTAVTFSPDDRYVYTGDARGHGRVWDITTGQVAMRCEGHSAAITEAVFLPDGTRVLTSSRDKTVGQWDLRTGRERRELVLRHPDTVTSLALLPGGRQLLTGCEDGQVRLWDIEQAEVLRTFADGITVRTLSLSPDGRLVLGLDAETGRVCLWDVETGREVPPPTEAANENIGKNGTTWSVQFSPDGRTAVTVGGNDVRLWDIYTREELMTFNPVGTVASANFSPDGRHVVTGSWDNAARIWDVATGQAVQKLLGGHTDDVNSAVYSPDGTQVMTAGDDGLVVLWDVATGKLLRTLQGHTDRVNSAVFSPDTKWALTASDDRTARVWDITTGAELAVLRGHEWAVLSATFSADARQVVTAGDDATARVWTLRPDDNWNVETARVLSGHTAAVTGAVFSPDGRRIVTASRDDTAKIWDTRNGQELLTLKGHRQDLTGVTFSPDGRHVLSTARDGTAVMWLTGRGLDTDNSR